MNNTPTLYERIGGETGLETMVAGLYARVLADPQLSPFFKNTTTERLKKMQQEFMRAALGATSSYSGLELSWVHGKRGITVHHFNLFCQHMFAALKEAGVDKATVQEVVGHMAVYKNDITGEAY